MLDKEEVVHSRGTLLERLEERDGLDALLLPMVATALTTPAVEAQVPPRRVDEHVQRALAAGVALSHVAGVLTEGTKHQHGSTAARDQGTGQA
jgi:hypothetical protein